MNTQDNFPEILKEQLAEAVATAQTVAAIQLQAAQGDLVQVANVIINASAVASVTAVSSALILAGIIPGSADQSSPSAPDQSDAGRPENSSGPAE